LLTDESHSVTKSKDLHIVLAFLKQAQSSFVQHMRIATKT